MGATYSSRTRTFFLQMSSGSHLEFFVRAIRILAHLDLSVLPSLCKRSASRSEARLKPASTSSGGGAGMAFPPLIFSPKPTPGRPPPILVAGPTSPFVFFRRLPLPLPPLSPPQHSTP